MITTYIIFSYVSVFSFLSVFRYRYTGNWQNKDDHLRNCERYVIVRIQFSSSKNYMLNECLFVLMCVNQEQQRNLIVLKKYLLLFSIMMMICEPILCNEFMFLVFESGWTYMIHDNHHHYKQQQNIDCVCVCVVSVCLTQST